MCLCLEFVVDRNGAMCEEPHAKLHVVRSSKHFACVLNTLPISDVPKTRATAAWSFGMWPCLEFGAHRKRDMLMRHMRNVVLCIQGHVSHLFYTFFVKEARKSPNKNTRMCHHSTHSQIPKFKVALARVLWVLVFKKCLWLERRASF